MRLCLFEFSETVKSRNLKKGDKIIFRTKISSPHGGVVVHACNSQSSGLWVHITWGESSHWLSLQKRQLKIKQRSLKIKQSASVQNSFMQFLYRQQEFQGRITDAGANVWFAVLQRIIVNIKQVYRCALQLAERSFNIENNCTFSCFIFYFFVYRFITPHCKESQKQICVLSSLFLAFMCMRYLFVLNRWCSTSL